MIYLVGIWILKKFWLFAININKKWEGMISMKKFKKATMIIAGVMALAMVGCGKTKKSATPTDADHATASDAAVIEDDGDWVTTEVPVVENERFTTVEGADVMGFDFSDGNIGPFVSYVNLGDMKLVNKNKELVCEINRVGNVEHGCQVYYDGFTMARDCVYTMKFDVRCDIERTVQWRIQVNGGDYHAYASEYIDIGPETKSVCYEFTMNEQSDPAPRFVVNMGKMDGSEGDLPPHKIYFDNISLIVTDGSKAEKIEGAPIPIQVKVNQLGYLPDDIKSVVTTSPDDEKFKIVKADTGETVYVGKYDDVKFDRAVQLQIRRAEFTDFKTPGRYKIISSPSGESYEFTIGEDIYDDVYKDVVLMLYKQRCGTSIDPAIAGDFAHGECHMGLAIPYGSPSSALVDVSGGWHDAGDYGRYVVPGTKTIQDLLLAYEDYGYAADDIGIPESGNGTPDLLDEARYELEWMLKMQDPATGGVYHKVTGKVFPETVLAEEETEQLYLAPISYAATCDFAAVMAKSSIIYAPFDKEFADKCLAAAENAYAYIETAKVESFINPKEIVTGEYPDTVLVDEGLWAAAELYIATGDAKYKTAIDTIFEGKVTCGLGWADIGGFALYDLAKNDKVDAAIRERSKSEFFAEVDKHIEACGKDVFHMGMLDEYRWGSNMQVANYAQLLIMANRLEPNPEYINLAKQHRDFIFGLNPVGYCYVTGYGANSPCHTHHRPSQKLGKTMPGMLVGGANAGFNDPYSKAVLTGTAGGKCYVDNEQSFSCNEITIYWNSPLIYDMTALMNE